MKKLLLILISLSFMLPLQACSKEYSLMTNEEGIPFYFEELISPGLKQFITDDINLILKYNEKMQIKAITQKYKTLEGTKIKKSNYLNWDGVKYVPRKISDDFGKLKKKNGKEHILINKNIIRFYSEIYKKKEHYQQLHEEIKGFLTFMNNIENIDVDEVPNPRDLFYLVGYSEDEKKEMYDASNKEDVEKYKSNFKKAYMDTKFFIPSLISICDAGDIAEAEKGKECVELVYKRNGKISSGAIGLIKDSGKWKLLIVMPGT